ncbi:hypothetical protein CW304_12825 [Bacillus sp. UFRGS-B20]|nr:hypothetical protein CW304_12825 [Bacillus sp. UFRGS-B20]
MLHKHPQRFRLHDQRQSTKLICLIPLSFAILLPLVQLVEAYQQNSKIKALQKQIKSSYTWFPLYFERTILCASFSCSS